MSWSICGVLAIAAYRQRSLLLSIMTTGPKAYHLPAIDQREQNIMSIKAMAQGDLFTIRRQALLRLTEVPLIRSNVVALVTFRILKKSSRNDLVHHQGCIQNKAASSAY